MKTWEIGLRVGTGILACAAVVGLLVLFLAYPKDSKPQTNSKKMKGERCSTSLDCVGELHCENSACIEMPPYVAPAEHEPSKAEVARNATPPIYITGRELYAAYDANEVSADSNYKGHWLIITGLVVSIDKNFMDDIIVRFAGGSYDWRNVMAYISEAETVQAGRLSKGDVVKVLCVGGGMIIHSPVLRDCIFQ
jgi:hypothetical protein